MQAQSAIDANSGIKKAKSRNLLQDFNGADGRIRTGDLILTKDALYLLSYISAFRISRTQVLLYYSQREKAIGYWQNNGRAATFYILCDTPIVFAQFASSSASRADTVKASFPNRPSR